MNSTQRLGAKWKTGGPLLLGLILAGCGVEAPSPGEVLLLAPGVGEVLPSESVTLSWQPEGAAMPLLYQVRWSNGETGAVLGEETLEDTTLLLAKLPQDVDIEWSVRALLRGQDDVRGELRQGLFRCEVPEAPRPGALLAPPEGLLPERMPAFRWEEARDPDPGARLSYRLLLGRSEDLADARTLPAGPTGLEMPAGLDDGTWYWALEVNDETGLAARSPQRSFTVTAPEAQLRVTPDPPASSAPSPPPPSPLAGAEVPEASESPERQAEPVRAASEATGEAVEAPQLVSPMGGAAITKDEVWLFWNPAPADSLVYEVELANSPTFEDARVIRTEELAHRLTKGDAPADAVWWRVRSVTREGAAGEPGPGRSLSFTAPAPPLVIQPRAGATGPLAVGSPSRGTFFGLKTRWTGEAGMLSEAYRVDGRDAAKPGGYTRWFLRPTLVVNDRLRISTDLMYTTEERRGRLDRNRYRVDFDWITGGAQLGDFHRDWGANILSGLAMRGLNVDHRITERIEAGLLYGMRQGSERVRTTTQAEYDRQFLGARLALGGVEASQLELMGLHAKDLLGTLSAIDIELDSTETDTLLFPFDSLAFPDDEERVATARENLVALGRARLQLFEKALKLHMELGQSWITDDRLSPESGESTPADFLMSHRLSSREAQAAEVGASWQATSSLRLEGGFRRVDPGYESLGQVSSQGDRQESRAGFDAHLGAFRLRSSLSLQEDNLEGDKELTTERLTSRSQMRHTPGGNWNSSYSLSLVQLGNDGSGAESIDSRLLSLGTRQNWLLSESGLWRSFGLDYTFQQSSEGTEARKGNEGDSHNAGLSLGMEPASNLVMGPTLNYITTDLGGQSRESWIPGFGLRHSLWERRLVSRFNSSWAFTEGNDRLKLRLSSRYKLSTKDNLQLQLKTGQFRDGDDAQRDYTDFTIQFGWTRRF